MAVENKGFMGGSMKFGVSDELSPDEKERAPLLPLRMIAQRVVEAATRSSIESVLEIARAEDAPLTTPQPVVSRDDMRLS